MKATENRPTGGIERARAAHLGPERRRPLVLDAAFDLFLAHGYEGTSMDAVAKAAGVSKPVVYACYPSKGELFKALLQREEERVLGQIAAALPEDPGGDPERVLVDGFTAFLEAVVASPEAYRVVLLGEGGVNTAVAQRIRRGRERQVDAIAMLARTWLETQGLGDGEGRQGGDVEGTSRLVAHLIVGLAEAGARAMLSEPERWTPKVLGRRLGRLAARGQAALG